MERIFKKFNFEKAIRTMVMIRTAELFIRESFWNEKIFSFLHLSIGQEASATGVGMALEKKDYMLGNHRSHGHYLAKGGDLDLMVYEVFGDQRGCCKGFGGSMHMLDRSVGFNGSTPILGSIPSIAVGQSFAADKLNIENVTVVFIGDGSAEEGSFMESVNLAANKNCRIIFVIEDNRYSVNSSHLDRKSRSYSHKSLFEGLGANYITCDGQDVCQVYSSACESVNYCLVERMPVVLHLNTLRRHAHSGPILEEKDEDYRLTDSVAYRDERDCISVASELAIDNGFGIDDIQNWINTEEEMTKERLIKIKKSIKVRTLD
jgi:TPP-dependent pyruvate/acetoin dehydrogenase alpha subunit